MESTNAQVRTVQGYGGRNGLPEEYAYVFRGYVYRGTGEDIMPWAITDDKRVATLAELGIELKRPRSARSARSRCQQCDHSYSSRWHKANCDLR
jgi:hypothetical protein